MTDSIKQDNVMEQAPEIYSDLPQRRQTMRLSVAEGMIALVMIGLVQTYYVPYLDSLHASKFSIGLGFGFYLLAQGIPQIWAPSILRFVGTYKNLVIIGTAIQAVFLIPFALMVHWFPDRAVWLSIGVMIISAAAGGVGAGSWSDWMSYIVPRRMRGSYFGFRTSMMTLSQLIASIIASLMLDRAKTIDYINNAAMEQLTLARHVIFVFTIMWLVSAAARAVATGLLFWHYNPPEIYARPPKHISFMDFAGRLHTHSYGKFVLAFSLIYFGAYFSAPFFALHMINDLHFTYFQYSCVQLIVPLMTVLSLGMWGRISNRLGNIMPMRLAATLILLLPSCWLISGNFWYLLVLNMVAGIAWGGFQLLTFNYSIGELPSGQRFAYISYMNAVAAIFYFAGSTLGGWIGPMLPSMSQYQYHSIFLFSTLLRLPACLIFQSLKTDEPAGTKMTPIEKFFFQSSRFIQGRFTR